MAVMAPYPAYLSDYANGNIEKMVLNLTLTDINLSNKQVKLRLFIQSQNTIIAKSNTEIINEPTLILDGGVPQRFTSTELAVYFNLENLQGITQDAYSQPLPEGVYTFGFEVFDYFTGNKLSGRIQQLFWLTLSDPPLLNMPSNNENIRDADPNNPQIVFQWTPRGTQVSQTEYTFTLSELWDDEGNSSQQFLAAIPKYETTTNNTTLIYGISDPPLLAGRTYAWRVQAKAKAGLENVGLYRQEGYSNIFTFKYGGQCPMVENVQMEVKSYDRIYISWEPALTNISLHTAPAYTVAARKYTIDNNWQWVEFQTPNTYYNLVNIEANTEYEIKVGNNCPSGTSTLISYTLPQRTTTLANGQVAGIICGQVPAIDESNQNLIDRLSVNDVVMAGDFAVVLISVSGDQNGWSGEAWTKVKWLGDTKIKLKYKGIKVNTDKRLVGDGYFETTYDPSGKNIGDVDEVIKDISEILKYANDAINKAYSDIRQNIDDRIIAKQFFDDLLEAMNDPKSGATQEQKDFIRKNKKKLVDAFSDGIKKLREKIAKEGIPEDLVKENLRSSFVDAGKQVQSENLKSSTFVSAYAGYNQLYSDTGPVKQAIFYLGKYKYTVSFKKDVTNVTDTNFELEGIKYVVTLDRSTKKFYRFLNLLEFEKAKTALGEKAKDGLSIKELEAAGVTKLADNNYTIVEEELAPKTQAILEALISRHNRKKVDCYRKFSRLFI